METTLFQSLLIALAVGISSGSIGAFIILRRMALVGDALSHVALPGIAFALAYGIDPFWGALLFLLVAGAIIWWLEQKTTLPSDAIVGLLFTASLAIGILTIPDTEVLESLFGVFPRFPPFVFFLVVSVSLLLTLATFFFTKQFLFSTIAPEFAKVNDTKRRYNLFLYLIFGFVVALGIKLVGTLLMGALTIIPASIAKNISRSMTGYLMLSTFFGAAVAVGGTLFAQTFGFLPGPAIILFGVGIFVISFLFRR